MDQSQAHAFAAMLAFMPMFILVCLAIIVIPYWFIWKKAGFSPWLSLLMFLPFINIIALYVLAFSQWKVVPIAQPAFGYPQPPTQFTPPQQPSSFPPPQV
jgi:hypothetical protein